MENTCYILNSLIPFSMESYKIVRLLYLKFHIFFLHDEWSLHTSLLIMNITTVIFECFNLQVYCRSIALSSQFTNRRINFDQFHIFALLKQIKALCSWLRLIRVTLNTPKLAQKQTKLSLTASWGGKLTDTGTLCKCRPTVQQPQCCRAIFKNLP